MSAPGAPSSRSGLRSIRLPSVPPPDTQEGRAIALALFVGVVYVLLLVGVNTPLADSDFVWLPLVLVLATIVCFSLAMILGADFGRIRHLELELARTVSVHSGTGQLPEPNTPLGKVLLEYSRTTEEMRRTARVHAYAAGPAFWGGFFTLGAALLWGLSFSTTTIWLNYLAVVVELPAIVLLFFSITVLVNRVGFARAMPGFESITPRHWRHFDRRSAAIDEAVAALPWLAPEPSELPAPAAPAPGPWAEEAARA